MTVIDRINSVARRFPVALWIVAANVTVFVGLRLTAVVLRFSGSNLSIDKIIDSLMLSSSPDEILRRPWTVLTYMFVQYDAGHLLINMLWLYAFAAVVGRVISGLRLWMLYLLGGVGGAIGYFAATCWFADGVGDGLVGASASALAVMAAAMVLCPQRKFNLFIFGEVSLKVLGLIFILLVVAATGSNEYGSHLAHGGGFAVGLLLALLWTQSMATPSPRNEKNKASVTSEASLDQLLDKIRTSGYGSLSDAERQRLFKISSNLSNADRK